MIAKNLQASWRYLKANPLFTLINVAGLVIGITCALFIFIYVSFETSYDRFHPRHEDIYRVIGIDSALGVSNSYVGITMPPLGPAMVETVPGVEHSVRIDDEGDAFIAVDDRNHYVEALALTEDAFFDMFGFELLQSQGEVLLDKPHAAVLTAAFAERVFGGTDVLGRVFTWEEQDIEVVGVLANPPPDSHMRFEVLMALEYLNPEEEGAQNRQEFLDAWGPIGMVTYVRLEPGADAADVEAGMKALIAERSPRPTFSAMLQPLRDAHLRSAEILFDDFNRNKGDAQKVAMLASVAVFVLLIAAFNFMNLSTARAALRAREVGMRKVAGATRLQLIQQFLLESFLLVGCALLLALGLLWLLEPVVSLPLDAGFLSFLFSQRQLLLLAALGFTVLGLLAGSYPAFVLSAFAPVAVLKGRFAGTGQGLWLRRVLVVLQFALSIAIIIGMLVVAEQLSYLRNRDPGFVRDGIVNVELGSEAMVTNYAALKERILAVPEVQAVAGSTSMPGQTFPRIGLRLPDTTDESPLIMSGLAVDTAYFDTLGMSLVAGRGFGDEYVSDAEESVILNESAVRALGWGEAVGRGIQMGPRQRTVVGVVRDFNYADMRHEIEPMVLLVDNDALRILSIRIDRNAPRAALEGIRAAWEEVNPAYPFEYTFFTEEYEALFRADEEFSAMLNQFTFVAMLIACMGLYGLASFSAEQKTKEIGIRKVLGATTPSLLRLVLAEYGLLLLAANVLAWAAAWYVMRDWLAGFVYRTELPLASFALATLVTAVLAVATVARQTMRVVAAKPVESLRYE